MHTGLNLGWGALDSELVVGSGALPCNVVPAAISAFPKTSSRLRQQFNTLGPSISQHAMPGSLTDLLLGLAVYHESHVDMLAAVLQLPQHAKRRQFELSTAIGGVAGCAVGWRKDLLVCRRCVCACVDRLGKLSFL